MAMSAGFFFAPGSWASPWAASVSGLALPAWPLVHFRGVYPKPPTCHPACPALGNLEFDNGCKH